MIRSTLLAGLVTAVLAIPPARGSDHADPADPFRISTNDDRGLAGLFVFPVKGEAPVENPRDGDALVFIVTANRALVKPPPYDGLDAFTFKIFLDLQRAVAVQYPADRNAPATETERATARYGGVVQNPELLGPNVTITMRLHNALEGFGDLNFLEKSAMIDRGEGPKPLAVSKWGAGVRDDPFVFPMFFGTNVIAMAVKVPYQSLGVADTFCAWATMERRGEQVDHVGRSQRTQLPRFDFLNTLPPSEHVAAIRKMRDDPNLRQDVSKFLIPTEFNFRAFDVQPDVMVFTKAHAAGYPNGRRLPDDIAKLACEQGDCQLFELSFVEPRNPDSKAHARYVGGRPTANDMPFLDKWPYLAEPWPSHDPAPVSFLTTKNWVYLGLIALAGLVVFLLPWLLYFRELRRLRRLRAATPPRPAVPTTPPGGIQL